MGKKRINKIEIYKLVVFLHIYKGIDKNDHR